MHCSAPFAVERPVAEEDWLMAFVARDALPGLGLPAGLDGIAALATPIGQLLVALIREAGARLPEMTISDAAGVRDAITALLRATLSPSSDNLAAAQPQAAAMMRQRIRAVIRAQMGLATLTPERLCRETGLSRTSLYRLFEPLGGVAAAIDAERLAYARRRIEDLAERRTIAQIAEEVGYFDPSAFSRAFRRRYGTTATEVRETARAGQPPVATISKVSGRSFLDLVARAEW
jgi:AraC-like DNA-binding protein